MTLTVGKGVKANSPQFASGPFIYIAFEVVQNVLQITADCKCFCEKGAGHKVVKKGFMKRDLTGL